MIPRTTPAIAACLVIPFLNAFAQEPKLGPDRIEMLEKKLAEARLQMAELHRTMESLTQALTEIKSSPAVQAQLSSTKVVDPTLRAEKHASDFERRILLPDLEGDERDKELTGRPELFVQSRYHALPLEQATNEDIRPNFALTRMETRWSGRVSDRLGLGFELQYHPAPQGASFEIVNDAFVEYYATGNLTVRAGRS